MDVAESLTLSKTGWTTNDKQCLFYMWDLDLRFMYPSFHVCVSVCVVWGCDMEIPVREGNRGAETNDRGGKWRGREPGE